jgi:hypothetical protein
MVLLCGRVQPNVRQMRWHGEFLVLLLLVLDCWSLRSGPWPIIRGRWLVWDAPSVIGRTRTTCKRDVVWPTQCYGDATRRVVALTWVLWRRDATGCGFDLVTTVTGFSTDESLIHISCAIGATRRDGDKTPTKITKNAEPEQQLLQSTFSFQIENVRVKHPSRRRLSPHGRVGLGIATPNSQLPTQLNWASFKACLIHEG